MLKVVLGDFQKIYNDFQALTIYCTLSNVLFAGAMREMRWLPMCVTGVTFALTSSVASRVAHGLVLKYIPEKYDIDHPLSWVSYFTFFLSMAVVGSALCTQWTLLRLGRSAPLRSIVQLTATDLIPFFYRALYYSDFEGPSHT